MNGRPLSVEVAQKGKLLRLCLNRPTANIIDAEMISAIDGALDEHLDNPDIHAVLLDASGPHFSFGASVEEHLPDRCAGMLKAIHDLILRIAGCPVPVLVVVQGKCLGGGLELALAAHMMFVQPDAKLGQPEINLGVIAPAASCLLPERIGRAAAEDILLSGREISGEEAVKIGLAHVATRDPEAVALAYFEAHFVNKSSSSLRYAVQAARLGFVERLKERLDAVEKLYLDGLMRTRDGVEGLEAFMEKRAPKWENR